MIYEIVSIWMLYSPVFIGHLSTLFIPTAELLGFNTSSRTIGLPTDPKIQSPANNVTSLGYPDRFQEGKYCSNSSQKAPCTPIQNLLVTHTILYQLLDSMRRTKIRVFSPVEAPQCTLLKPHWSGGEASCHSERTVTGHPITERRHHGR